MAERLEQAFETTSTDEPRWYYEESGNKFWLQNRAGDWVSMPKDLFRQHLKALGYRVKPEEGELIAQADAEIQETVLNRRVAYAGPLAGYFRGVQNFESSLCLVTKSPELIECKEGEWTLLGDFLNNLFNPSREVEAGNDQLSLLFGWWQHVVQCLYSGSPMNGLCLGIAGEAGCGKTLLKDFIKATLGGREVMPYAWMTGRDNFQAQLSASVLWTVDDEQSSTNYKDRLAFGDKIKKITANNNFDFRAMHKESVTLNPLRRLVVCVNDEPEKIVVLPPIDDDIADKLLLLKAYRAPFPMPMSTPDEKRAFFQAIVDELPAFLYWLRFEYKLPDSVQGDRYGVTHWHHPEIAHELYAMGQEYQLLDWIDRALFRMAGEDSWTGSAEDLRHLLIGDESALFDTEKREVAKAHVLGKQIAKLAKRYPTRFQRHRTASTNNWEIRSEKCLS